MSKRKFVLSLADGYLTLEVLQAPSGKSLRSAWQQTLAYLHGEPPPNFQVIESRYLAGDTSGAGLAILLQKGLDTIKTLAPNPQERMLEVVLGPTLSRVGIVEWGAPGEAPHWSNAERDSFVDAWVAQNWGIQAQACVVRSAPVGNQGRHLVTCVERSTVQTIEMLCGQAGFQLESCTPALALQLSRPLAPQVDRSGAGDIAPSQALRVCVFVQTASDSRHTALVHFVVLDAGEPLTITRMWLPDAGHSSQEQLYRSVVNRLRAQYRYAVAPEVEVITWPPNASRGRAV